MRERLRIFFYLGGFWLTLMFAGRILFLVYNYDYAKTLTTGEKILTMLHGLRMDASITGYFLAFSGLLLTISVFKNSLWIGRTLTVVSLLLLIVTSVIITVDLELYRHWGFRLNTTPLMYIGSEAMGSIEAIVIVKVGLIFLLLVSTGAFVFIRKIFPRIEYLGDAKPKSALVLFAVSALMFIPIRGSFTVAPMNTGFVYFHNTKPFANHAAINVVWNFLYSVRKSANQNYPENFFDKKATNRLIDSLYTSGDSTISILKTSRPNIILLILESFTADVIEPLGGVKNLTPNLNALCDEGVLFTNFYASGDRTDKGLISILSGYPAQPQTSIIKLPNKTQSLPHLNTHLKRLGYTTSFIYGGDVDFANFRSYLNTGGFDHITTLDDFDDELYTSKWGVHDHYMFDKAFHELIKEQNPFFKVILTLSSHEPFDVPGEKFNEGNSQEALFLNSCHYTDKSVGTFITKCKQQPWWDNTLLIITADHGHRHPGKKQLKDKERFKIPLLMLGGAVTRDTTLHTLGGQTDIANTLLAQIDKTHPEFSFSKNLLDIQAKPFAAYFFNDGYGFLLPDKYIVYDNPGKQFLIQQNADAEDLNLSKAYQQKLFLDYNHRGE
ncbi:MAG TPA: sulfatase-like hydrolase/transferase [Ohtaekwangia sp.]|nr:sulfatase-like hydrolase/transferase [Ohtaekwangia sp.]